MSDPQMVEVYRVGKGLARTSKVEIKTLIHTKRCQRVQVREKMLSVGWDRYDWNRI